MSLFLYYRLFDRYSIYSGEFNYEKIFFLIMVSRRCSSDFIMYNPCLKKRTNSLYKEE
jgi:hypothetical protein